jgi:hypothetical protein
MIAAAKTYALITMVCGPLAHPPAMADGYGPSFAYVAREGTPAVTCRLIEPPWGADLTLGECNRMKRERARATLGGGVRHECVPEDKD